MSVFYGSDTYCITDIGLIDQIVTNPAQLVGQRLARRWTTPRGALAAVNDDPNFGWDVRQYLNARITPAQIAIAQQQLANEALKDEQIASIDVTVTFTDPYLVIEAAGQLSAGPTFTLTMNVSSLTVEAIFNFGS